MTEHEASRTLVKSPPELWEECSDAASLARHLGQFGEIRITRVEPETAVGWEGEGVRGTVRIEPSGWGTRVTLTASTVREEPGIEEPPAAPAPPPPPAAKAPPPDHSSESSPPPRQARADLLTRVVSLFRSRRSQPLSPPLGLVSAAEPSALGDPPGAPGLPPASEPPPAPEASPPTEPPFHEPESQAADDVADADSPSPDPEAALTAALDSLGQAHHRPFSRA